MPSRTPPSIFAIFIGESYHVPRGRTRPMPFTRFELVLRRPLADGRAFGDVGPYEELRGRIRLAVDPDNPANRGITDLALAPRGPGGYVECAADVSILLPVDRARASGRVLLDVVNRGNAVAVPN